MGTSVQLPGRRQDDVFIHRRGKNVLWQRSMYCSCFNHDSGQPDFNCPICFGSGYQYEAAVQEKMLMTNVKQDKNYSVVAVWELGTCRATFKSHVTVGFRDRISFLGIFLTFSDLLTRAQRPSLGAKDFLRFSQVQNILKVTQRDPVTKVLTTYTENTDYKLVTDANNAYIEWQAGGHKPADGTQYSALYENLPEWLVWDVPQVRTDSEYTQLPKFSILRRKDMVDSSPKT